MQSKYEARALSDILSESKENWEILSLICVGIPISRQAVSGEAFSLVKKI